MEAINGLYELSFLSTPTEVVHDGETLTIYIDGRTSVVVESVDEARAIEIAQELLKKWDFSYTLEFESSDDYKAYFN